MASDAAKALYPDLAKRETQASQPQALNRVRAGVNAGEAMYGKPPPPRPTRVRAPMTYDNLSRVPGLVR
jgi:hypothetical protein